MVRLRPDDLRRCRERAGISQNELARRTGILQNRISTWERGLYQPNDPEPVLRMAEALGVAVEEIADIHQGDLEDAERTRAVDPELLDCSLEQFMRMMAEAYDDWEEFIAWTRARGNG